MADRPMIAWIFETEEYTESQSADTLIPADHLDISDMGNMGMGFGGKGERQPNRQ